MIKKQFEKIIRFIKIRKFKKIATIGIGFETCSKANLIIRNNGQISIGSHCDIQGLLLSNGGNIIIGNNSTIRYQTDICSVNKIKIGNNVIISNNVHIYDSNSHPTSPKIRLEMCANGFYTKQWDWRLSDNKEIIIEDNVWLGERSTILKGLSIGKGSIVACDSVVTKDVPEYVIVAGNPAKIVKKLYSEINDIELSNNIK